MVAPGLHRVRCGALVLAALFVPAALSAGPYSSGLANSTPGAIDPGVPGFVGPAGNGVVTDGNFVNPVFTGWADTVINAQPGARRQRRILQCHPRALGPVTGDNFGVVSLGDLPVTGAGSTPGSITVKFSTSIVNGAGADFAVFGGNALVSQGGAGVSGQIFGELAYVEVSSDGSNFARFRQASALTSSPVWPLRDHRMAQDEASTTSPANMRTATMVPGAHRSISRHSPAIPRFSMAR